MSNTYLFNGLAYYFTPPSTGTTSTAYVTVYAGSNLPTYTILSSFVIGSITYTVNEIWINGFTASTNTTSIVIPNTITKIGAGAFANCTALPRIELPSSLIRIDGDANGTTNGTFQGCTSLTSITFNSNGALTVGNNVFKNFNRSLTLIYNSIPTFINANISNFTFTNNLSGVNLVINATGTIPDNSFENLKILSVTIGNNITNLGRFTFQNCTSLTNVTLNNGLAVIGDFAFGNCNLIPSINIPSTVTSCNSFAFSYCTSITSVSINTNLSNIVSILQNIFSPILKNLNLKNLTFNYSGTIPTAIYPYSFSLQNVVIQSGITSIGISAFNGCVNLSNVSIPSTVTSIGDYAFANCTLLNNLVIPSSVSTFYKNNFVGLPNPYKVILSNASHLNLLDESNNIIWYYINIKRNSNNLSIFNGYFSIDSTTGLINVLYNLNDLTKNIITSVQNNNNGANYLFNTVTNNFSNEGTVITSIPALDTEFNAANWIINGTTSSLSYRNATTNVWQSLPAGTVTITETRMYTNPIPSIDIPTISPVCFPAGTPVLTDQGIMAIEQINTKYFTINGNKIKAITKTISLEDQLLLIKKDAIKENVPNQDTVITMNHEILFNNIMTKAKDLLGKVKEIYPIKYNNEYLYNVLLDKHSVMVVNNMVVETLHPENIIATIYNSTIDENERLKISMTLNNAILNKDYDKYDEFFKLIKIC